MTALHDVISPVTEEVVASVPSLSLEETDVAIARSKAAFQTWRHVSPGDRARILRRFSVLVDEVGQMLDLSDHVGLEMVVEDGSKLMGISAWVCYAALSTRGLVTNRFTPPRRQRA